MLLSAIFNNLFSFSGRTSNNEDSKVERVEFLATIDKFTLSLFPYLGGLVVCLALNYTEISGVYKYIWLGLNISSRFLLHFLYEILQQSLHSDFSNFSRIKASFRLSALFYGIIWGSSVFLFYPLNVPIDTSSYWILSACLIAVISSYGLMSLPRVDMFLLFSLPIIILASVRAVSDNVPGSAWIVAGYLCLLISQMIYASRFRKIYKEQIVLKMQNEELVSTLKKNQLSLNENIKTLEHLSLRDELTQLPNRRFLMNKYLSLQTMVKQHDEFSLMVLDLDHFKLINDQYGHLIGDKVLVHVAQILRDNIRSTDFAARVGGEEFVILLPKIKESKALATAERIRRTIENQVFKDGNNNHFKVTISIGLARGVIGEEIADVFQNADEAVYQAKQNGRNCVRKAGDKSLLPIHLSFDPPSEVNSYLN